MCGLYKFDDVDGLEEFIEGSSRHKEGVRSGDADTVRWRRRSWISGRRGPGSGSTQLGELFAMHKTTMWGLKIKSGLWVFHGIEA
jgi:hypothetical protein